MRAHHLSLILAIAALPAVQAQAQTLPWPTDAPGTTGAIPGAVAPPGPMPAPMPMGPMASPAIGSPFGAPAAPQGSSPCLPEFLRLREDVEKKGLAAKQASEHKATREEMCKYISVYAAAELKWVKYAESGVATCGVPASVAQELKKVHSHTEDTKSKICAVAAVGAPVGPSLSDALGTTKLPPPGTKKGGTGTLDTLTGNAIAR